jgi:hypothetical protein
LGEKPCLERGYPHPGEIKQGQFAFRGFDLGREKPLKETAKEIQPKPYSEYSEAYVNVK